jgi:hypothetical protein
MSARAPRRRTLRGGRKSAGIEPNYLIPEVEKYHVEDLVLISEGAPRVLSRTTDWSRLLAPGA